MELFLLWIIPLGQTPINNILGLEGIDTFMTLVIHY